MMHPKYFTAFMAFGLLFTFSVQAGFTPPTWKQLDEAATDPAKLPALLKDASPAQAAVVLVRAFDMVGSKFAQSDSKAHREKVARLTAQAVAAMGEKAVVMVQHVAENACPRQMPIVAAVYSILLGKDVPGLVEALTTNLSSETAAQVRGAVQQPALVIPPNLIITIGSESDGKPGLLGGETSAQPLSPILVPEGQGGGAPPPPPVPGRYPGQ